MIKSALVLAALAIPTAACAPVSEAIQQNPSVPVECVKGKMPTITAGKLTIGVEKPAVSPYYYQNRPENGQGFEAALAYEIAAELGYGKNDVAWVDQVFTQAVQPGAKKFDLDINEFTITDERAQQVDFSDPYYTNYQTIVVMKSSTGNRVPTGDRVPTMADLKKMKFGVQVGTTSYNTVVEQIQPDDAPAAFEGHEEVKAALRAGQIDAAVMDMGTATNVSAFEVEGSRVLGKLPPPPGAEPEQFGIVLERGSKLTVCVNGALNSLRGKNSLPKLVAPVVPGKRPTLDSEPALLEQEWLSQGKVPEIAS